MGYLFIGYDQKYKYARAYTHAHIYTCTKRGFSYRSIKSLQNIYYLLASR